MWMSDKPLIQEQLCEDMGSLFYSFDNPAIAVQFYGRFLETIGQEWLGIDHWRLDKFMMLVRRVTRHLFTVLHRHEWTAELLKELRKAITGTIFKEGAMSFGCTMHFLSLFWEEVAKVTEGKIQTRAVTGLIRPFLAFLADTRDQRLSKRVVVDIFYGLLKQSDLGRQYEEKYEVWKQFGFPSERLDDLELVEEPKQTEEEEEDVEMESDENGEAVKEKIALDPRAGNVSVVLAEIPLNARKIHQLMEKTIYDAGTRSANRRVIKKIMANYEKFSAGKYPLGVQRVVLPQTEAAKMPNIDEKVEALESLEESLLEDTRLMRTLSKAERKRFYKSGLTPRDFLESLGRVKRNNEEESNGLVVESITEGLNKKKKRKSMDQGEDDEEDQEEIKGSAKKKLKKKQQQELDSSIDLDNGFEVEEAVDEEKEAKVQPPKKKKNKSNGSAVFPVESDWDKPLQEGEVEYLVTPTKQRLKHLNSAMADLPVSSGKKVKLVKNPFAATNGSAAKKVKEPESPKTPVNKLTSAAVQLKTPTSSGKRVKIMLERNMAQEKSEYFRQLRNSPQIPFDSTKKPLKGLLKPHSMPSPINPYYKKKIGLQLDNE